MRQLNALAPAHILTPFKGLPTDFHQSKIKSGSGPEVLRALLLQKEEWLILVGLSNSKQRRPDGTQGSSMEMGKVCHFLMISERSDAIACLCRPVHDNNELPEAIEDDGAVEVTANDVEEEIVCA